MTLLGLNAWVVVFLVPSLHLPDRGLAAWALAGTGLALLAAGIAGLGARPEGARIALLALYPSVLGLAVAASPALVEREVFDPLTSVLGGASLLAYVALAARSCARAEDLRPSTSHPSAGRDPVAEPRARRWMRRALLGLTAVGGFVMVAVAPVWATRAERAALWGEARDDGAVLAVVVASVTAALAIGAIVGPALRAERRPNRSVLGGRRSLWLSLGLAAAALAGWLVLEYLDSTA